MTTKINPWVAAFGLTVRWEDDWSVGDHVKEYDCYEDGPPSTCERAAAFDKHGYCWAALGCIDDATDEYRAEIERELLEEAVTNILRERAA